MEIDRIDMETYGELARKVLPKMADWTLNLHERNIDWML